MKPDLGDRQLDHVLQDQDLALAQGQPAQGGDHVHDLGGGRGHGLAGLAQPFGGQAPVAARRSPLRA